MRPTSSAIQTNAGGLSTEGSSATLDLTRLTSVLEASRLVWHDMIKAPDGVAGSLYGQVGISTALPQAEETQVQEHWATRSSQGGLEDQGQFADFCAIFSFGSGMNQHASASGVFPLVEGLANGTSVVADHVGGHHDPALSPDRHAVQAQHDAFLLGGEKSSFPNAIVNERVAYHTPVGDDRALVGESSVGIAYGDLSSHFASGGGDGTVADLKVLQLQQLTLQPLIMLNGFWPVGRGLEGPNFVSAARLDETEQQQSQSAVAHNAPFGSPTVLLDQNGVNQSGVFSTGFVGLTAD